MFRDPIDYKEDSEFSRLNLWQNRPFPKNMTILPKLTLLAVLILTSAWVAAAPPRVVGNRPAAVQTPGGAGDRVARRLASDNDFVAAVFGVDDEPAAEGEGKRSPQRELRKSREQLLKVKSISAKIVERVDVLDMGRSFKAEGRYLQMGLRDGDWKMRMELAIKIGSANGSLLEVCDGELLWIRTDIDTGRKKDNPEGGKKDLRDTRINRCNVVKILNAAKKLPDKTYEKTIITSLGLGGLPALLAALEQTMEFTSVKDGTLRDKPMLVIEGTWSEPFAKRLRGSMQPGQPGAGLLPPTAPDSVKIYIDRETGFPHRISYLKKIAGRDVHRQMLTLDFLDVEINQPISGSEFDYVPPKNVAPQEITKGFLDQLMPAGKSDGPQAGNLPPK
jgi:hypothetical protein